MSNPMERRPTPGRDMNLHAQEQIGKIGAKLLRERFDIGPGTTSYTLGQEPERSLLLVSTSEAQIDAIMTMIANWPS
jgi:hypothetical protein